MPMTYRCRMRILETWIDRALPVIVSRFLMPRHTRHRGATAPRTTVPIFTMTCQYYWTRSTGGRRWHFCRL
eukprot:118364-Ditylum_brightwellii.AAC.1